ncbi:hypothetical protein J6590_031273 [Homalodisca vitripennis]|nr:hypothetical protein J6590_091429 [Homalodisca vitripennis]KAG8326922.1 hypothetical protein J6590_031273 [Homalodisca vitripennis]
MFTRLAIKLIYSDQMTRDTWCDTCDRLNIPAWQHYATECAALIWDTFYIHIGEHHSSPCGLLILHCTYYSDLQASGNMQVKID